MSNKNKGGKPMPLQQSEKKQELRHYIYTDAGYAILITPEEYQELSDIYDANDSSTRLFGIYVVKPGTNQERKIPMGNIDHIGKVEEEV